MFRVINHTLRGITLLCGHWVNAQAVESTQLKLCDALKALNQSTDIHFIHSKVSLKNFTVDTSQPVNNQVEHTLSTWLEPLNLQWRWLGDDTIEILPASVEDNVYKPQALMLEEIEVLGRRATGSLLQSSYAKTWPISARLTRPQLVNNSAHSPAENLQRTLPQVAGHAINSNLSNGGNVSASLNLRGLPSQYSLVLVDGLRMAPTLRDTASTDLNTLPTAMAESIELHASGASATYGADAVAGALNYQLDRSSEGLAIQLGGGIASEGDLSTNAMNIRWGSQWTQGKALLAASYFDQDGLMSHQRNLSADQRDQGGVDLRSSATPRGRIYFTDGQVLTARANYRLDRPTEQQYRVADNDDKYDFAEQTSAVLPMQQASYYGYFEYPLGHNIETSLSVHHNINQGENTRAAKPLMSNSGFPSWQFSPENQYNPFEQAPVTVKRRLVELGPRVFNHKRQLSAASWRLAQGFTVQDQPWQWRTTVHYSSARDQQSFRNLVSRNRLARAAGPDAACQSDPACVPINLVAPAGYITQDMLDYIAASENVEMRSRLAEISAQVDGPWQIQDRQVNTALGVLYRYEYSEQDFVGTDDELNSRYQGDRQLVELFGEANMNIWQDRLELAGSARLSLDRDLGFISSPNIQINSHLSSSISLRLGAGSGYQAPSLFELHSENYLFSSRLQDPCSDPSKVNQLPGCNGLADTNQLQFSTLLSGNPDLEPESSRYWRAGLSWHPDITTQPQFQVDYVSTDIYDVITDASAQSVVNQSANSTAQEATGGRVFRNALGDIQWVQTHYINYGERHVDALDLSSNLHWSLAGDWHWQTLASYLINYQDLSDPGNSADNLAGTYDPHSRGGNDGLPKWQVSSDVQWHLQNWQLGYQLIYVDSMQETIPYSDTTRTIDHWLTHNISLSLSPSYFEGVRLTLNIDNLLDTPPPFVASSFNNGLDGNLHNLRGRFFSAQLHLQW